MRWWICLCLSMLCAVAGAGMYFRQGKKADRDRTEAMIVLLAGVFAASAFLFLPVYFQYFSDAYDPPASLLLTLLMSLHNAIRLFVVDSDFEPVKSQTAYLANPLRDLFAGWAALLFLAAPVLTAGTVLTLFKSLLFRVELVRRKNSAVFLFSELNEASVTLAEDIARDPGRAFEEEKRRAFQRQLQKPLFVFADDYGNDVPESMAELRLRAARIRARTVRKDVLELEELYGKCHVPVQVYLIGGDEQENVIQAVTLMERCRDREKLQMFVFAPSSVSGVLLNTAFHGQEVRAELRRINVIRSGVWHYLEKETEAQTTIFDEALAPLPGDATGRKRINVCILGLGQYGTEMLKALVWACQMDGYRLEINAFDVRADAEERLRAACPALMEAPPSPDADIDTAGYRVFVHGGCDVETAAFSEALGALEQPTFVFAALGDDLRNATAATRLRGELKARYPDACPRILAVIGNGETASALQNAKDKDGKGYHLDCIGMTEDIFRADVVTLTELEREARDEYRQAQARDPEQGRQKEYRFLHFEYNYRSSIARRIHVRLRKRCGLPGADVPKDVRRETHPEEYKALCRLEHRRWNAFMRTEGFRFGKTKDGKGDHIAKVHPDLTAWDALDDQKKAYDNV